MLFIDQEISLQRAIATAAKNAIIAGFMDVLYDQLRSIRASIY